MTFADVEEILPYLTNLGITDVFFSPILQAAPGSTHGYDVVDHERISDTLGGREAFEHCANKIHEAGMGLIVDVVPNHMAVPTPLYYNRVIWSTLRDGFESPYLHWLDVELSEAGDGLLMPILGDRIGNVLARGEITVEKMVVPGFEQDGETAVVKYFDHVFPIRPGTENLPLVELLDRQFYRLAYWRVANDELNYRRFFDVDTLAAIRVEDPDVFQESHALLLDLYGSGHIDGFRIDHPDGLADPRQYLRRLHEATDGAWIVAEKILNGDETLPSDWSCSGTTGYDTLRRIGGVMTDPAGIADLAQAYVEITESTDSLAVVEEKSKRQIILTSLFAEVDRLANLIRDICHSDVRLRDYTYRSISEALVELIVAMDRYRAYVVPKERPSQDDEAVLRTAAEHARKHLDAFRAESLDVVLDILLGNEVGSAGRTHEARRNEVIIRFQQVCGAVMAKGVEDTTYYRYTVQTAANEVGFGPEHMVCTPDEFHSFEASLHDSWPVTMTTLSTHDTKRGEDVRARITVLSEFSALWTETLSQMRASLAEVRPADLDGQIENLLWQTLVGTWSDDGPISFERLDAYLLKASREQKSWTTWTEQNESAEAALLEYAHTILETDEVRESLQMIHDRTAPAARAVILGQKAIQMTAIGIPDVYQGEEVTQTSLVDPDNRRPIDFAKLEANLARLDESGLASKANIDDEKLWLTSRLARLRAAHPELADGRWGYTSLPVSTGHAMAFARTDADGEATIATIVTRFAGTLEANGGFGDRTVVIPAGTWRNVLTNETLEGETVLLADVLKNFPVAVLEKM